MRRTRLILTLSLWFASSLVGTAHSQEDPLAKELPRIPAHDPLDALRTFQIKEGFQLELVAAEPLVSSPVSLCYDADGRAYVVEMIGYPFVEQHPTGSIRLIEDRDGDGRFDHSSRFLDNLPWPTSVLPYDGGIFITAVPDILYAKDTNGDGIADIRKVLFTGFNSQNVQALLNGLLWGPDGWVYGVGGGNGGDIQNLTRPGDPKVSVRGRDFRFLPDASCFEAISGGGQFGHAFDDWGHRFTSNNSNHIRQIVLPSHYLERNPALTTSAVVLDIPAEGPAAPVYRISPAEPWRIVRTRQRAADPEMVKRLAPTELKATGFFTSATGVTIYRGSAYAAEYRGNAFIGDVGGNLVHRKTVSRNGAVFLATRAEEGREFLASTDNWFRPVNFTNTPNGTLLILDMYRETIEHPFSIPEPIKKHLDLTSGKERGRLYEIVPTGGRRQRRPTLGSATTAELVAFLADPDAWWRETAQRLLIERRDPAALPLLKALAKARPTPLGRTHALWTLAIYGKLAADEVLLAIGDPDPSVREQGARLSEPLVATESSLVEPLLALARDAEPMVRFQAAFSIGAIADPKAVAALAQIALRDGSDYWVRAAVLSSVAGRASHLFDALAASPGFLESGAGRVWLEEIPMLIGAENRPAEVDALLKRATDLAPRLVAPVLAGLGRGLHRSGGSLRERLQGRGAPALQPLFARASTIAASDQPESVRVDAIRLVGLGPNDAALTALPDLLDVKQPVAIQMATLQSLAAVSDRRVGPILTKRWKSLSPSLRREAVEVLFARAERVAALLDAIEAKAVSSSDIDPARRKQLREHSNPLIRERATKLLSDDSRTDRGAIIAEYRKALELTGDREKGRAVHKALCATCHRAEGQGVAVGPDLNTVASRTPEDLLIHILDPNREVAPISVNYQVATTDGLIVTGIIADESANAVTLKRAEGVTEVVPRTRIESIASTGLSLMPEGLEKGRSAQEFADLISFLRSLSASAPAAAPR